VGALEMKLELPVEAILESIFAVQRFNKIKVIDVSEFNAYTFTCSGCDDLLTTSLLNGKLIEITKANEAIISEIDKKWNRIQELKIEIENIRKGFTYLDLRNYR
jgi:hypothetical protein